MIVGLVGATNVGKSTLFNRLIGQFRAIVTDIAGTTRDILYHKVLLQNDDEVIFADSPGLLDFTDERPLITKIIDAADILLFMIDDTAGITAKEQQIIEYITKKNKKNQTICVINKIDKKRKEHQTELALSDYYHLWFPTMFGISAKTKRNIPELQDALMTMVYKHKESQTINESKEAAQVLKESWIQTDNSGIPIAILGKPNAGKSTLLNKLVGQEMAKVENEAGTTRDYVVGSFVMNKQKYTIYDTAGIRKQGSMHGIERISYEKTMDMLEFVRPVVIFMIDASLGISHRDMTLLEEINRLALPIIFALNKSDLLDAKQLKEVIATTQRMMDFAKYIPILMMSAKTGKGTEDIFKFVKNIRKESEKRVTTTELNKIISTEFFSRPPRFPKNKICKIMYMTQIDINAPTFMVFVNHKARANFSFKKWIDNTLRKHFGFVGVPLVIRFKDRRESTPDRAMPGKSIETMDKEIEARQERIEKNAERILLKRKKKKQAA